VKYLLMLALLCPSLAFCKLLQHDKVRLIAGEYEGCTAEMALDEDDNQGKEENNGKYALRNIRCVYSNGEVWTVLTLTWIPKVDVEKIK